MSRKPKNALTKMQEIKQEIATAPDDETAVSNETPAPLVEAAVAEDKSAEPKARKAGKTANGGRTKKSGKKTKEAAKEVTVERKKPGPKPMTPEQKAEAAKARAEEKRKAENMKPTIIVEYFGVQTDANTLLERAKDAFHAERKRTLITDLKLYVKPDERAAYYVVNERFTGKISF